MIRRCEERDFDEIGEIINDAAQAYRGIIPADRWKEPYMPGEELRQEIEEGVQFWGYEEEGALIGVMGAQDKGEVALIRHAYVRTAHRGRGIGGALLAHLLDRIEKPVLIGTWADASWAVRFYENRGFAKVSEERKTRWLRRYWSIPDRQIETSVVLADAKAFSLE